jgi:hypothetical protein
MVMSTVGMRTIDRKNAVMSRKYVVAAKGACSSFHWCEGRVRFRRRLVV